MENIYYIYMHLTKDSGEIFYIGKGKNRRAYEKYNRNKYWRHIAEKHGYTIEFAEKGLSEDAAFSLEKELITKHSPRANMTKGGEGTSGFKHNPDVVKIRNENNRILNKTEEGKLKKSLSQKESLKIPGALEKRLAGLNRFYGEVKKGTKKHPWIGRKRTPEEILKISNGQKGEKGFWYGKTTAVAKKVINLDTNQIFLTLKAAAASVGGGYRSLSKSLKIGRKFKKTRFAWYK